MTATHFEEIKQREYALKSSIIAEINRQVKALAQETQHGLNKITHSINRSNAAGSNKNSKVKTVFSNNFPKEGIEYQVQVGDTLSGIAKKFNSTVADIQNANKISDPSRDLRAGQKIFVPQKN